MNEAKAVTDMSLEELNEAFYHYTKTFAGVVTKDTLVFAFHSADILYLQKVDGIWTDKTPEGMLAEPNIVKTEKGLEIIKPVNTKQ